MIKRLAITDYIMHKDKGSYWNGNKVDGEQKIEQIEQFDEKIKSTKFGMMEDMQSTGQIETTPGFEVEQEQYMSVDDMSVRSDKKFKFGKKKNMKSKTLIMSEDMNKHFSMKADSETPMSVYEKPSKSLKQLSATSSVAQSRTSTVKSSEKNMLLPSKLNKKQDFLFYEIMAAFAQKNIDAKTSSKQNMGKMYIEKEFRSSI